MNPESAFANKPDEIDQARVYVLDPAPVSPVALGRKVDDEARVVEAVAVIDEHSAGLDLAGFAGPGIGFPIVLKGSLELEGEAAAHDPRRS